MARSLEPTVGGIVHWVPPQEIRATYGRDWPARVAAILADVHEGGAVDLDPRLPWRCARPPVETTERVPFDPNGAPGTWHWPEGGDDDNT